MPAGLESAARRYADAVFEIAQGESRLPEWEQELELLAAAFSGPGVVAWLGNPSVPQDEKDALIDTALASASEEARNLAHLLVARGRADLAPAILEVYRARFDAVRGIVHATVTTAIPLSDTDLTAVTNRLSDLTHQQVQVETRVDPSIIGGVVVRMGDRLIDGSARSRLLALKRRLAGRGS
jgi:F-type H+-transporting ATPase subunit delta